jgi:hypothetical protein
MGVECYTLSQSMPSTKEAPLASGISAQRAALDAILRSRTFSKNLRLSALLEYLCLRHFRGEADSLKEYNIATDVFGRPIDFDQSQDAIVRVEMHRLRKKLAEYYATEGQAEPIQIVIHSGHYAPDFIQREKLASSAEPLEAPGKELRAIAEAPPEIHRAPEWAPWAGGILASTALLAALGFFWPGHARQAPRPSSVSGASMAAALPGESFRILCGSSAGGVRDREGNIWSADAFYSGGYAAALPDQQVFRTQDSLLYRSARTGEFSYRIPLKAGVYEMRLYFADQSYSPGVAMEGGENTRVFTVMLNGEALLRDFDIIADAGPNTADVRAFKDIQPASDGYLHLAFVKNLGSPLVNAIEIVPGTPHRMRPIRIATQERTFTDKAGLSWLAENYFLNGRRIARQMLIKGTEDPQVYEWERYGNFSYAIPVSDGRYRLTLHFAESYWGPNAPGGGGAGIRVFDVYCNGVALLRNFDMLQEASPGTQIVKTFDNLRPNAQGKLLLSFVPVKNYANVSAIEVVEEPEANE